MDEHWLIDGGACTPGQQRGAGVAAVFLVALTVSCLCFAPIQLAGPSSLLPAFGLLSLVTDGVVAGLLLSQCRFAGTQAVMRLGAAYLFSASIEVARLIGSSSLAGDEPVGGAASLWLGCIGHAGFAVCILWFVSGRSTPLRAGAVAHLAGRVGIVAACLAAVAFSGLPPWPWLAAGSNSGELVAGALEVATLALLFVAGVSVVARLRGRLSLRLCLAAGLFAAYVDASLTLAGIGRFTVGWYTTECLGLTSGLGLLFALVFGLVKEAERIAEANVHLKLMLQTDVLTGLANRRAFETGLDAEWRRAQREQTAISLLMIDIDSFKGFNDRYGHPAGDRCLRAVGRALAGQAYRPGDVAARIGGEEFGIILPVTDEAGALQVAERLRAGVASQGLRHEGSSSGYVTISIGAATIRPFTLPGDATRLVEVADNALYRAKAAGRNTVRGCGCPPVLLAAV